MPDYDPRFKTEVDGTKHRLIITDGKADDIGKYKLVVKEAKTSAMLAVSGIAQKNIIFTADLCHTECR